MVKRVLQAVYREVRGLHEAAYVLALFTFGSQILALVRDRMLAHQFGAGQELDLYYTAFRIPDLLYVLFASTLSVYVLIPFVAERVEATSSKRAKELLSQIFTLFLVSYALLAAVLAIAAPYILPILFPGFTESLGELTLLVRILLLQPFFLGLSSLFGVITQLGHRFVLYAISPLIYNLGIIGGLLFLYPTFGLSGLVVGVVIGAVGHGAIQLPFIFASDIAPSLVHSISWPDIRNILATSLPRALTLSLHQIVLLGLVGIASTMSEGSVSVFQFAFNLQSVPLAIIGVSYSVAAFPVLAQFHAEGKLERFQVHITTALRHIIFWTFPVIALVIVVRAQFVRVVLGSGAFNWDDTRLTAAVLALFIVSLAAQAINLLIVRALYAAGNTKLPFYVTLFSSAGILILAFFLHQFYALVPEFKYALDALLRVSSVAGAEVLVLALGYTIALVFHTTILLSLGASKLSFSLGSMNAHFFKAFAAALSAGVTAYVALNFLVLGLKTETLLGIFLQGFLASIAGVCGAVLTYYALRSEELKEVYTSFRKRIFKTDVIAPQDEDHLAV